MKKAQYKDYSKESDYFKVKNDEQLNNDIKSVEKSKKFIVWVQEFSKKIVVVVSILFILLSLVSVLFLYLSYISGNMMGIDTFITETNETFRIVIGGYIIKAAAENSFKIAGNYFVGITDARLNALNKKYNKDANGEKTEFENSDEECIDA